MYQIGNARVRIHGDVSRSQIQTATEKFIRSVEYQKRKETNERATKAVGEMEAGHKGMDGG